MKKKNINSLLLDSEIKVSDDEIKALAALSKKSNAEIYETVEKNIFQLIIKFDEDSEQILISNDSLENYLTNAKEFFKKFVKYGGEIDLSEVFKTVKSQLIN